MRQLRLFALEYCALSKLFTISRFELQSFAKPPENWVKPKTKYTPKTKIVNNKALRNKNPISFVFIVAILC